MMNLLDMFDLLELTGTLKLEGKDLLEIINHRYLADPAKFAC